MESGELGMRTWGGRGGVVPRLVVPVSGVQLYEK